MKGRIKMCEKVYFSSLLKSSKYSDSTKPLFDALTENQIEYGFIENTKDIWVRDFMPVKTKNNKYISFKYNPCYLKGIPELRTNYKKDISQQFALPIIYSSINLDGGNIVFSPSREKAIISDRIFSENKNYDTSLLISKLENLLSAEVIIIPSLPYKSSVNSQLQSDFFELFSEFDEAENKGEHVAKMRVLFEKLNPTENKDSIERKFLEFFATHDTDEVEFTNGMAHLSTGNFEETDMTGHADGMIRFIDDNTVLGNNIHTELEEDIKNALSKYNINVVDFPYYETRERNNDNVSSAEGCYLNFLETEKCIFLPEFESPWDCDAIEIAHNVFPLKRIIPINMLEIAKEGGLLNCISWEF